MSTINLRVEALVRLSARLEAQGSLEKAVVALTRAITIDSGQSESLQVRHFDCQFRHLLHAPPLAHTHVVTFILALAGLRPCTCWIEVLCTSSQDFTRPCAAIKAILLIHSSSFVRWHALSLFA